MPHTKDKLQIQLYLEKHLYLYIYEKHVNGENDLITLMSFQCDFLQWNTK